MQDPSPVQDKGPPKSITVEDSFKDCSSLSAAEHVIRVLTPDLLARMVEDFQVQEEEEEVTPLASQQGCTLSCKGLGRGFY